jgi:hypothetical protein
MKNPKNSTIIISALIIIAALSRFIPHPPNFTPIGGIALFGAAHFTKKYWAFIIPFIGLWASDLILNNVVYAQYFDGFVLFSPSFYWTVAAFATIVLIMSNTNLLKEIKPMKLLGASLMASVIFFLVSNFGSWMSGAMYPKTFAGLMTCYTAGIPFFWNTLAGDLFYVTSLFGIFEVYKYYNAKNELSIIN